MMLKKNAGLGHCILSRLGAFETMTVCGGAFWRPSMGEASINRNLNMALIGSASCLNCKHRLKFNQGVFCRKNPPQVFSIPMQHAGNGQVQWVVQSAYPTVNPDWPCGEHERSELHAAEELASAARGTAQ